MSNNFINNQIQKVLNYRDLDLVMFELCESIIAQANLSPPLPFNNPDTYYQDLKKGRVLDNWGVDLFTDSNLHDEYTKDGVEYFLAFLVDQDRSEQLDKCNYSIVCDFSFMLSDCNPSGLGSSKQRLTRMVDLFIESILKNNSDLIATTETAISIDQLAELGKYKIPLKASRLLSRVSSLGESINKTNYITSNIRIQFLITQIQ
jgi:hypothetical protein